MRGGSEPFRKARPSVGLLSKDALPFLGGRFRSCFLKREAEGREALSEYQVAAINIRKNMARLREFRLAKEVADRATER